LLLDKAVNKSRADCKYSCRPVALNSAKVPKLC